MSNLYPAMLAMELRESKACARLSVRGMQSMAAHQSPSVRGDIGTCTHAEALGPLTHSVGLLGLQGLQQVRRPGWVDVADQAAAPIVALRQLYMAADLLMGQRGR